MDHNKDILDGLADILGDAVTAEPQAPIASAKRARRTKAEMAAATDLAPAAMVSPEAPVPAPVPAPAQFDPMARQHGFSGRKLRIIIDKGHGKDDPTSVFLRLNNYEATAQRGVPVELYDEVVAACLDNAVQTVFAQPQEGVLVPHDSLRFSYRIVR